MARFSLWLLVVLLGIDIGAGLYETRVVVPLWSAGVPETLATGNPYGQVAINAGIDFWAVVSTSVAVAALLALIVGLRTPAPERFWRTLAAGGELVAVAATLLYFRPTLVRLFMEHGSGVSAGELTGTVQRWVAWNRVRLAVSFVAWISALYALSIAARQPSGA